MVLEIIWRVKSERGLQLMAQVLYQAPDAAESAEFMHVWNAFNPEDVANVLAQIPKIKSVFVASPMRVVVPLLTAVETSIVPPSLRFRILPVLEYCQISESL